jgi:uncharacterized Tic20 family protein
MNVEINQIELPQPHDIPIREKEDAMGAYLMMFAGVAVALPLPLLNLVASFVYLYLNKNKGRFVHFHCLQALYSQIPVTILNLGLLTWLIVILAGDLTFTAEFKGFGIMVLAVNMVDLVFSLIAAAKARKGLFFGRISYQQAFITRQHTEKKLVNMPPKM